MKKNIQKELQYLNIYEKIMPCEDFGYIELINPNSDGEVLCKVTDTKLQRDIVANAAYTYVEPIEQDDLLNIVIHSYDFDGNAIIKDDMYTSYYGNLRYSDLPETVKSMIPAL